MPETPSPPHNWYDFLYLFGAPVLAYLAAEFRHWYKLRGERRKEQSSANKDDAEAEQIHITSSKDASNEIVRSAGLLANAKLEIGRLRWQLEEYKHEKKQWQRDRLEYEKVKAQNKVMELTIEQYEQSKRMEGR
jgi:hypothetical protein